MIWTLLLAALAVAEPGTPGPDLSGEWAWELPRPIDPSPHDCPEAVDLVPGRPLPDGLVDEDGIVRCYATVVPTSDLAHLILTEAWAIEAAPRGRRIVLETEWEEERYRALLDVYRAPTPWLDRPGVQRSLGRVETVVVLGLALGVYAVLDGQIVR